MSFESSLKEMSDDLSVVILITRNIPSTLNEYRIELIKDFSDIDWDQVLKQGLDKLDQMRLAYMRRFFINSLVFDDFEAAINYAGDLVREEETKSGSRPDMQIVTVECSFG